MSVMHGAHADVGLLASTLTLVAIWFAMMSAMMAPVVWPWVVAFNRVNVHARAGRATSTAGFVAGYAVAWLLYSTLAATIQILVARRSGVGADGDVPAIAAGLALAGAGLFQFSPLKRACLTHCRHPFTYLLSRWRNGPMPAWRIGFGHGVFCVGCCWALMATMLVVGVMNAWWMAAITVATFVEQVARRGDLARAGVGIALVATGVAYMLT